MPKLNVEDLIKIKESYKAVFTLREGGYRAKITVHMGTCGIAAGARTVMEALIDEIHKQGASDVIASASGCAGLCSKEPMATVEIVGEAPVKYGQLDAEKIKKIFKEHVLNGSPVQEYALAAGCESSY
ncbi:MAG: (2Fe-2S) ferredoxin domain-containing protein [Nitrospiraceae bacterium]|nr:(2Fe-2S) ferredoxin domain-containing protein [Nitrospiraceae bacterium]